MKVRVLGCSGAIAKDCRTTAFLIGEKVLIDAGTGVGDLTLEEMCKIDHVFLTHSHLDHIAALPLMLDAVSTRRPHPLQVHALPATIEALERHLFNDVIWPDFSRIPTPAQPFLTYVALTTGQQVEISGMTIEVLPAVHTVPAVGYMVQGRDGWWVFSGDTERNPAFWARLSAMQVSMLVIETTFSNRERDLAHRSMHLAPSTLAQELANIPPDVRYPIYVTHTKPSETELIMDEICRFDDAAAHQGSSRHDIRRLIAGQTFDL